MVEVKEMIVEGIGEEMRENHLVMEECHLRLSLSEDYISSIVSSSFGVSK